MSRCYPFGQHNSCIIYEERSDRKYIGGSLQTDLKFLNSDEDLYDHNLKWSPCGLCTMKREYIYVLLSCGHTFHKYCITKRFEQSILCPLCYDLYGTRNFYPYGVSFIKDKPREKPNVPIPFL